MKTVARIKKTAAYDLDEANKGLWASYRAPGVEEDAVEGVVLADTNRGKTRKIVLNGFEGADAGVIDLPKDTRIWLKTVLSDPDLRVLFEAMRDEGLEPILCQPLDAHKETAQSISAMLDEAGDSATHVVIRNAFGNEDKILPSNDFYDGDMAEELDFPARTLARLGGIEIVLPDVGDTGAVLKKRDLRFRASMSVFDREGDRNERRRVENFLKKTDAAWETILSSIPAVADGSRKPIFLFVSDKGGVGKSMSAKTCLDYLRYGDR